MKRNGALVFVLTTVALAFVCLYQQRALRAERRSNQELNEQLQQQRQQQLATFSEALATVPTSISGSAVAEAAATSGQPLPVTPAAPADETAAAASAKPAAPLSLSKDDTGNIRKMMDNPQMQEMVRSQQEGMLKVQFGSLFERLNLAPEVLETFKKLLVDKQMAAVDMGLAMMGGGMSDEEMTTAMADIEEAHKELDEVILDLVGQEAFDLYKGYEETVGQRMQVSSLRTALADTPNPITTELEDRLVNIMVEEQEGFDFTRNLADQDSSFTPDKLTDEMIDTFVDEQNRLNTQILDRARAILTPEQLEQFGDVMEQQLNMMSMGMRMARGMFGGGEQ